MAALGYGSDEGGLASRLAAIRAGMAAAARRAGRPEDSVRLVAVSKRQPAAAIAEARRAGQLDFGENYPQELRDKQKELAAEPGFSSLRWHMIGPLQRNKVHMVVGQVALVHSVDRLELIEALAARVLRDREKQPELVVDCLIEVSVAGEAQKAGCTAAELPQLLDAIAEKGGALRARGLMCIPPLADDPEASRPHFRRLAELRAEQAQPSCARPHVELVELSMGMSHDYEVAIAEGATLIRVGTAIFGKRPEG